MQVAAAYGAGEHATKSLQGPLNALLEETLSP